MFKNKLFPAVLCKRNLCWIKPEGHDTGIKVYNCVTRDKQPLIVKNKNLVTWYTCGPTVYDSSHLGHASCFMKLDIIQKILKTHFHLNLITVMNITDIDDKIIARSKQLQISTNELTKQYEKEFWQDFLKLNIAKPDCTLRVTENMKFVQKCIKKLIQDKKAYTAQGSVYFDLTVHKNYGKLQNLGEPPKSVPEFKKSSMDFALWKAGKPGEIFWESEWGCGRPGWHIECTALATLIFGSCIDIHAGGIDLRFPHHENEEAQSCALHGTDQWVNYWLHTGHLHLKNCEKMSKSLKNTVSVGEMLKTTTPETFRMACFMSHYRKSMEFSPEFMETAQCTLNNYINFLNTCNDYINGVVPMEINDETIEKIVGEFPGKIHEALIDDFNTPMVVNVLNQTVSVVNNVFNSSRKVDEIDKVNVGIIAVRNLVQGTLDLVGLNVSGKRLSEQNSSFVEVVDSLNSFRQEVRQLGIRTNDQNLLKLCDSVRDELKKSGITIKDHGKVSSWS